LVEVGREVEVLWKPAPLVDSAPLVECWVADRVALLMVALREIGLPVPEEAAVPVMLAMVELWPGVMMPPPTPPAVAVAVADPAEVDEDDDVVVEASSPAPSIVKGPK